MVAFLSVAVVAAHAQPVISPAAVQIDRVIAVVNDRAILASDLTEEMRAAVLEPNGNSKAETPQDALERLISRALIRQQIREEDVQAAMPTADEVAARVAALRKELPICIREQCATEAGWKNFLETHGLTQPRVESYLRNRLVILRFIEIRFRQGIQISQEEIGDYYKSTLLPQYPAGQTAPPLEEVSPRIEEILLQQVQPARCSPAGSTTCASKATSKFSILPLKPRHIQRHPERERHERLRVGSAAG